MNNLKTYVLSMDWKQSSLQQKRWVQKQVNVISKLIDEDNKDEEEPVYKVEVPANR